MPFSPFLKGIKILLFLSSPSFSHPDKDNLSFEDNQFIGWTVWKHLTYSMLGFFLSGLFFCNLTSLLLVLIMLADSKITVFKKGQHTQALNIELSQCYQFFLPHQHLVDTAFLLLTYAWNYFLLPNKMHLAGNMNNAPWTFSFARIFILLLLSYSVANLLFFCSLAPRVWHEWWEAQFH